MPDQPEPDSVGAHRPIAMTTSGHSVISEYGMRPFALAPGDGTSVENPTGGVTTFKAVGDQTGGGLTVIEGVSAPGEGPPLHVHRGQDEFIFTLDGTFRVRLGDDLIEVLPRSFVFIPRDTPHTWQNVGEESSRFVAALSPASVEFEEFFQRYGVLSPDERGIDAFSRLAAETGAMEVLGPPLAQSDPR
jgi:quercetin dioxygenase-like cupin family protein